MKAVAACPPSSGASRHLLPAGEGHKGRRRCATVRLNKAAHFTVKRLARHCRAGFGRPVGLCILAGILPSRKPTMLAHLIEFAINHYVLSGSFGGEQQGQQHHERSTQYIVVNDEFNQVGEHLYDPGR